MIRFINCLFIKNNLKMKTNHSLHQYHQSLFLFRSCEKYSLFIIILSILLLLFLPQFSHSQCWCYTFTYSTGHTYNALSSPTQLIAGDVDDEISASTAIGFTFSYNGIDYTTFKASSNGFVNLGGALTDSYPSNDLESSTKKEILAPLWDDLETNTTGSVNYELTGSSGSYILKIEFKNLDHLGYGTNMYFQVWLYEATYEVEFRYGDMGTWTGQSASIGIDDETNYRFLSITPAATPTSSSTVVNNDIATNDYLVSGLRYSFNKGSDWYWWKGATSTDWATTSNWYGSTLPTTSQHVTISKGKTYDPIIDESAACDDLGIGDGTKVTVNTGANLTPDDDIWVCSGGEFELNDGTVSVTRDFRSVANSIVDINGGTLNIGSDWERNNDGENARGTIDISGGVINVADDCRFSSSDVTGTMSGSFALTVGDEFENTNDDWTVTGGTVTLTAEYDGHAQLTTTSSTRDAEVWNLVIDADGGVSDIFDFFSSSYNSGVIIGGSFTFTDGTIETKNVTYHTDFLTVAGAFSMGSDAHFKDAIESTDTYSVGSYSFNAASTYEMYGTTQNIPATTFGHLNVSATGTKSLSGSTTVAGNLNVSTGILSITVDNDLTIAGTTTNSVGTAGIVVESGASGTGSLIHNTASINGTVERYLTDNSWHFISPSTTGVTALTYWWNEAPKCWLSYHTESTNAWTYNTILTTPMPVGQGWSVWLDLNTKSAATATMTGELRATDLSVSLTKDADGWNLIGNPFSSAIDRDEGSWGSNTTGTVYVWDNDYNGGDYRTWNGSTGDLTGGIIPISQGFFEQASSAGSFTIPAAARVHNTTDFYKSTNNPNSSPYVRLQMDCGDHGNTVFIGFPANGTSQFDYKGDAGKLYSYSDLPQIYVVEDNIKLSINALETLTITGKTVPLHLDQAVDGNYTFTLSQIDSLPDVILSLEDLKTGNLQELTQNPVYAFTAAEGDDPDRFLLHFKLNDFGIDDPVNHSGDYINIYSNNNIIYIQSKEIAALEKGNVEIFNLIGQKVHEQKIEAATLISIPVDMSNSYLVVKVVKSCGIYTEKVFIR